MPWFLYVALGLCSVWMSWAWHPPYTPGQMILITCVSLVQAIWTIVLLRRVLAWYWRRYFSSPDS